MFLFISLNHVPVFWIHTCMYFVRVILQYFNFRGAIFVFHIPVIPVLPPYSTSVSFCPLAVCFASWYLHLSWSVFCSYTCTTETESFIKMLFLIFWCVGSPRSGSRVCRRPFGGHSAVSWYSAGVTQWDQLCQRAGFCSKATPLTSHCSTNL